jgi:AcrR family transcriptional regulator
MGLRERKKSRTRSEIQSQSLRLFREQGYEATTVEQITAAAEVSETTFYRYFPNKRDLVLTDELDPRIVEAIRAQPPELNAVQALRAALRSVLTALPPERREEARERTALVISVDELRASMLDQVAGAMHLIAAAVAERTGRSIDDSAVRTLAGAVVGATMAVTFATVDDPTADFATMIDESLAHLEAGLAL